MNEDGRKFMNAAEIYVEGRSSDLGAEHDLLDRDTLIAVLGNICAGDVDDFLSSLLRASPASARRRRRRNISAARCNHRRVYASQLERPDRRYANRVFVIGFARRRS